MITKRLWIPISENRNHISDIRIQNRSAIAMSICRALCVLVFLAEEWISMSQTNVWDKEFQPLNAEKRKLWIYCEDRLLQTWCFLSRNSLKTAPLGLFKRKLKDSEEGLWIFFWQDLNCWYLNDLWATGAMTSTSWYFVNRKLSLRWTFHWKETRISFL